MAFPNNNASAQIAKIQYSANVIRRMAVEIAAGSAQAPVYPNTIREFFSQIVAFQTIIDDATAIGNLNAVAQNYFADLSLDYAVEIQSVANLAFTAGASIYGVLPKATDAGQQWVLWERYDTGANQFVPRAFTTIPAPIIADLDALIAAIPDNI